MRTHRIWIVMAVLALAVSGAQAERIIEHVGAADPATEGFTPNGNPGLGSPLADDGGVAAWAINDTDDTELTYQYHYSPTELADMGTFGWIMRANIRIPTVSKALDSTAFVQSRQGDERYMLRWSTDASGNPTVHILGADSAAITGSGYHLYELVYDPAEGSADLFVDGSEVLSDQGPNIDAGTELMAWGSGSTSGHDPGAGNWNAVSIEVIPEPASLALLLAGTVLALRRRSA